MAVRTFCDDNGTLWPKQASKQEVFVGHSHGRSAPICREIRCRCVANVVSCAAAISACACAAAWHAALALSEDMVLNINSMRWLQIVICIIWYHEYLSCEPVSQIPPLRSCEECTEPSNAFIFRPFLLDFLVCRFKAHRQSLVWNGFQNMDRVMGPSSPVASSSLSACAVCSQWLPALRLFHGSRSCFGVTFLLGPVYTQILGLLILNLSNIPKLSVLLDQFEPQPTVHESSSSLAVIPRLATMGHTTVQRNTVTCSAATWLGFYVRRQSVHVCSTKLHWHLMQWSRQAISACDTAGVWLQAGQLATNVTLWYDLGLRGPGSGTWYGQDKGCQELVHLQCCLILKVNCHRQGVGGSKFPSKRYITWSYGHRIKVSFQGHECMPLGCSFNTGRRCTLRGHQAKRLQHERAAQWCDEPRRLVRKGNPM